MWLNRQVSKDFHTEFSVEEKLLDVRSEHILEVFKSKEFGQIALFDERDILFEKFIYIQSELLAHVGACSLPIASTNSAGAGAISADAGVGAESSVESKGANADSSAESIAGAESSALLLGGFNLEIAHELAKHRMQIDFLQSDEKVLDSLISFLPHFQEVRASRAFALYSKAIDLPLKKYDLIIHQSIPNAHEIDGLQRMLSAQGILIARLPHPYLQEEAFAQILGAFGKFFGIVMPFFAPLALFSDQGFVFASKATHPLADFCLHKCDMLKDLRFYNADIHQAVFALPSLLAQNLKGVIKN
ncbi:MULTISPECIES: spermidine synthase [unclassified Helicobacter]|uniref:spermine/spermidine synthase domain-containing protein n=1 Tax=unclassified Helicobacter TaxID=2593540 RepID=UPI000A8965F0|nr:MULTISPECIES: spermidine synthase [unclassified Helicobacter]